MIPPDDDLRGALRGADDASLGPDALRRLARHADARVRHAALLGIRDRARAPRTEAERRELGAMLPRELPPGMAPETAIVLAEIHRHLGQGQPLPAWREAALPAAAQIAWLRTEILLDPERLRDAPGGELLLQALSGIAPEDVAAPEALIRRLAARPEAALHTLALDLLRRGLHAVLLAPSQARAGLLEILDAGTPAAVAGALRELGEPWAVADPLPVGRLAAFFEGEPEVAEAAIALAARHGHEGPLRDLVADTGAAPRRRQWALGALGEILGRDAVGEVLALAGSDPLLLGPPALDGLRAMHRRGHFPGPEHAAALVDLALADHTLAADRIAAVGFTCRRALAEALADAPPEDPSWPRRLEIMTALWAQGAADLPLGLEIRAKLRAIVEDDAVPSDERPPVGPFLRALAEIRCAEAEEDVLAALPLAPADALEALRAIGGTRTVGALRAGLGLDGPGALDPGFAAESASALSLLWHLTVDRAERRALLARLRPGQIPPAVLADLGVPDHAELQLLQETVATAEVTPVEALVALAGAGDARSLPAISDLLLRIATDLADAWVPGGPAPAAPPDPFRGKSRPERPAMPAEVLAAVRELGARLFRRRQIRPVCLLDATTPPEAGNALFASLVHEILDRPELGPGERAVLLEAILDTPWRGTLPRVHRLLRHRDPHVRKAVIALLARDGAEALSASLTLLTGAGDVQTVRQALLALGGMKARWAAPAIAACLEHANMNVKKTAAEALATAGAPEVVPRLLFWLGRHDNPGLRSALEAALRAILGPAYRATLRAAADASTEDRRRDLLVEALGPAPAAPVPAPAPRPGEREVHALVHDGWSDVLAGRLLALPSPLDAREIAALRPLLRPLLGLARSEAPLRQAALRLAARFTRSGWSGEEIAAWARHLDVVLEAARDAPADLRDDLVAILEAVAPVLPAPEALGVAASVRALPPAPGAARSPIALLRRLGVLLQRTDVEQALAAAAVAADPWKSQPAILREAFGVRAPPSGDPPARVTAFREALRAAMPDPEALAALRAQPSPETGAQARLSALIDAFPTAEGVARANVRGQGPPTPPEKGRAPGTKASPAHALLLDWMEALQPLGAPPWTLAERDARPAPPARRPRPEDLDPPRSAAQRARLHALVEAGSVEAAATLLSWPEAAAHVPVVLAYLDGTLNLPLTTTLALALTRLTPDELDGEAPGSARELRTLRLLGALPAAELSRYFRKLHDWAFCVNHAVARLARSQLQRIPPDVRAARLHPRLEAGHWEEALEVLGDTPLIRTPLLHEMVARMRREGGEALAGRVRFAPGPFRKPEEASADARLLASLRTLAPRPATLAAAGISRPELVRLSRSSDAEEARRALSLLAAAPGPDLAELLQERMGDPRPRVRLHAHRLLRGVADRATYLRATATLLADPLPEVIRSSLRIVSFAAFLPAIPAVVDLLLHPHAAVRRAAADGLVQLGAPAVPALRSAQSHARPDRRAVYQDVLGRIASP